MSSISPERLSWLKEKQAKWQVYSLIGIAVGTITAFISTFFPASIIAAITENIGFAILVVALICGAITTAIQAAGK